MFLACLLFVAQVLPLLHTRWVEDESWYGAVGYSLAKEARIRNPLFWDKDPDSKVDTRPPGTAITLATAYTLFGVGPVRARLPFAFVGVGIVVLVFFLGSELAGPVTGLLATFLMATDNFLFLAARTVRPEALVTFFSILGVLLYLKALRKPSFSLALAAGLALGAALNCHPNALAAVAAAGLLTLAEFRWRFLAESRFWGLALGTFVGVLAFFFWVTSSPTHWSAFKYMYMQGQGIPWSEALAVERSRYSIFLGFSSAKLPLPFQVPSRIHIASAILLALVVLFPRNRPLFWKMVILIAPCPVVWFWQRHPSTRYIVVAAPALAILLAAAAQALVAAHAGWKRPIFATLVILALSQVAGNAFTLYSFRHADFQAVSTELRKLIPPGEGVYGAITFWMALYDRPYYSWNRTPLSYAISKGNVSYLILNDRVMMRGSGFYEDDWRQVRAITNEFAGRHATLVGRVSNSFYGNLDVYHVNRDSPISFPPSGQN